MTSTFWPNGTTTQPKVSSPFGPRNLSNPLASKNHKGTDFYGFEVVHSVADGKVVLARWAHETMGWLNVAGFMVWVQHDGYFSRSLHTAADTVRVREGDVVEAAQPLVDVGWSGLNSPSDAHVHLEIVPGQWHRGNVGQVDPVAFLSERIDKNTAGGGSATTPTDGNYITMAEAYVKAPNGTVAYLRPGGKINFKDPKHYASHQAVVKKLISAGATDLIKPPTLDNVPGVTWKQFEDICTIIGAPKS